jgi:hypothetical protein
MLEGESKIIEFMLETNLSWTNYPAVVVVLSAIHNRRQHYRCSEPAELQFTDTFRRSSRFLSLIMSRQYLYQLIACVSCLQIALCLATADDWPQWHGPRRDGIWREAGILERFPTEGPKLLWRAAIGGGYSGPAVSDGRVCARLEEHG